MAMLLVECRDCHSITSLRGWVEPEDLIGTMSAHFWWFRPLE